MSNTVEKRKKIVYATYIFHTTGGLVGLPTGSMDARSRPPGQPSGLPGWFFHFVEFLERFERFF